MTCSKTSHTVQGVVQPPEVVQMLGSVQQHETRLVRYRRLAGSKLAAVELV